MKKIFIALLMAGGLFASCDMDKKPYGSLDDTTAIQSLGDSQRFRDGLYSSLRSVTTGVFVYESDIQMDLFQGVIGNGNRNGMFSNGTFVTSDQYIQSRWGSMYSVINSANYLIEKIDQLLNNGTEFSDADRLTLSRYDGEAHFVRAYCYYWLLDHFCESYSSANAQTPAKGLPLVTVYNPTGDMSRYPGRSTQDETYARIEEDLDNAYTALTAYEQTDNAAIAPNATYLSSYAVQAMQARIALLKGDNATALSKAEAVINSGAYTLTPAASYADMWVKDEGSEVIFRPFMSATELSNSTGGAYLSTSLDMADYIPTYAMLSMYGEGDVRFDAFFTVWKLAVDGNDVQAYVFYKYPGNESLKTGTSPNYMNMSKPFRLSELYLIAAEAAAAASNTTTANKYLNDLRAARIVGYESGTYSGETLTNEIREERLKELIGEGYRMSDLRRWGLGFQRYADHPENPEIENILLATGRALSYQAGDHRYVWPIPTAEMEANPQLDGQQNPGY